MKKTLQFIACLLIAQTTFGQVLFEHNFESGELSPMTIIDADGLTPHPDVGALTEAFNVFPYGDGIAALSTSWFTPAGQADDWLLTPQIAINDATTVLKWSATSISTMFRDGYEIRVSTGGNEIADFTDVVYTIAEEEVGEDGSLIPREIPLGDYAGQEIFIAFRNNSVDKYILVIDDISVEEVRERSVAVNRFTSNKFNNLNTEVDVTAMITNRGSDVLQSVDFSWTDGTNTYTDNLTGLNLSRGESMEVTSSTKFTTSAAVQYPLDIWTSNPNGMDDQYTEDDMITGYLNGISSVPNKIVVGEEGTGTWCGWCPRGDVALKFMEMNYKEEFIGIAVHNRDPMVVSEYDSGLGIRGFPGGKVDRTFDIDPGNFEAGYNINKDVVAPLSASITAVANQWDRSVVINTEVDFVTGFDVYDYRLSVVITEDGVTGTTAAYDQSNFYSFASQNISLPSADGSFNWRDLPQPVPAADMVYDHVARAILGGFNGMEGSLPANVADGDKSEREIMYTVPTNMDIEKLHAIVLVIDNESGQILNAAKTDIAISTSTKEIVDETIANVYPNPATQIANIDINLANSADVYLTVTDVVGNVMDTKSFGKMSGVNKTTYDVSTLSSGVYVFKIKAGGLVTNKRIVVMN